MVRIYKRTAAKRDLIQHFVYLADHAGIEIAEQFLIEVESSIANLASFPEMGSPTPSGRQQLAGLRKCPVANFDKFLIFYAPHPHGISVVRVLHAAQDWWSLFEIV